MLASSQEYLQALRNENYLLFLEWPQFIASHYAMDKVLQDADTTVNLLVFEWLNHGFCRDDVKLFAIIFAVNDIKCRPLRGNLAYSMIALSIALFQCMVYQNHQIASHYLSKKKLTRLEIEQLMKDNSHYLTKALNEEYLRLEQAQFLKWTQESSLEQINKAFIQINNVTQLRYLVDEYLVKVESNPDEKDVFQSIRLSVIKRLASYLNEQMQLSDEVREELLLYVSKLRELNPKSYEEEYLRNLSPVILEPWKLITDIGLKFFKILQPSSEEATLHLELK